MPFMCVLVIKCQSTTKDTKENQIGRQDENYGNGWAALKEEESKKKNVARKKKMM